jgi:hypothetical protein
LLAVFEELGEVEDSVAAVKALAPLLEPVEESTLPPHPASADRAQIASTRSLTLETLSIIKYF